MAQHSHTLVIVGAGASHAISKKIPLMNNFFEDCLEQNDERDQIVSALSTLDYERMFDDRDEDFEKLSNESINSNTNQPSLESKDFGLLRKKIKSSKYNLEKVFENIPTTSESFPSLLYLINLIFGGEPSIQKDANCLYFSLFEKILDKGSSTCTFVSFNYDILLESALVNWIKEKLNPNPGEISKGIAQLFTRINAFHGYYDPEKFQELISKNPETIPEWEKFGDHSFVNKYDFRVAKPHGSVSFYKKYKNDPNKETYLLLGKDDSKTLNFDTFKKYQTFVCAPESKEKGERFRVIEPLIVPPKKIKTRSYPILFESERVFLEAVKSATRVIIIGWSLPDTDKEHYDSIRNKILDRNAHQQLDELIVIDKQKFEQAEIFDKFEALFQPKKMQRIFRGFSTESIQKIS